MIQKKKSKGLFFTFFLMLVISVSLFEQSVMFAEPQDAVDQEWERPNDVERASIERSIRSLGSKDEGERTDAINRLVRYYRKAIPSVLDALHNSDPLVRYGAVDVLIRMTYLGDTKKILEAFTKEKSVNVRLRYITLFSNAGINEPLVANALIKTLKMDKDEKVRAETATALVRFIGDEVETVLIEVLSGPETEFVKIYLAKALGERRSEKAIPIFESLLVPMEIGVGPFQQVVVKSLGQIGTKEAIRILINSLAHPRREVSAEACLTLAFLKKKSLEDLLVALQDKAKSKLIRGGAAEALGFMEDSTAYLPLKNAAKNDPEPYVRWKADEALGKIKTPNKDTFKQL